MRYHFTKAAAAAVARVERFVAHLKKGRF